MRGVNREPSFTQKLLQMVVVMVGFLRSLPSQPKPELMTFCPSENVRFCHFVFSMDAVIPGEPKIEKLYFVFESSGCKVLHRQQQDEVIKTARKFLPRLDDVTEEEVRSSRPLPS